LGSDVIRTPGLNADQVLREAAELSAALQAVDFEGWDPYDALSSPVLRTVSRTPRTRQVAIQSFKRLPVNLRPFVGMRPRRHAKALALCVSANALLAQFPGFGESRLLVETLAGDVVERAVTGSNGSIGWAYDFDVQTRWGFYPAGTPNAVVTAFAIHALFDAAALPDADPTFRDLAEAACQGALEMLLATIPEGQYFRYYEGSGIPIHNANLLLASAAARSTQTRRHEWHTVKNAVAFTVSHQRPDGSWPYGEGRGLDWVDGFHTAYNLVSLARCLEVGEDSSIEAALDRGLTFYNARLFEPSGAPRATVDRLYPIDIHGASSAIWSLARLRHRSPDALPLAERVLDWTLAHMQRHDGRYAFQLHARHRNSIPYVRWSDAHMLLALATLADARRQDAG
jgi:hypothetical protein